MHWEVARMYSEPESTDPANTRFFRDGTPHITRHECKVLHCTLHVSILSCVNQRFVWDCANFGRPTLLLLPLLLLLLVLRMLAPVMVRGSIAACVHDLLNTPKMPSVN